MVRFGAYQHHGVASGDGTVIHFGRGIFDLENAEIEQVSMADFCDGKSIEIVNSKRSFANAEIVDRARSRIGEKNYDLWDNNCEHFVNWCRSGEHESPQINLTESVARQSAAIASRPVIRHWVKRVAVRHVRVIAGGIAKGPILVACAADAVQATAEIVAVNQGKTKHETQRIGRSVGVASSVAIGWVVGGPITAAAGVGYWFAGQWFAEHAIDTGKQILNSVVTEPAVVN